MAFRLKRQTPCDVDDDDSESDFKPDSPNDMPLPPENFYATEGEMWTSIQTWATQHKYAF